MKKLVASLLVLTLALSPVVSPAATLDLFGTNYVFENNLLISSLAVGECVQTGAGGLLTTTGAACGGGGGGGGVALTGVTSGGVIGTFLPGIGPAALAVTNWLSVSAAVGDIPVGTTIGHINVSCSAYNSADVTAGNSPYSPLDANGLGGGTIDFGIQNATFSGAAPFNLGSVVIPDSPQAGPWVTSVTSAVTPYTVLSGDSLVMTVPTISGTATQWVYDCTPMIGP
jgi:hypothetical protein